MTSYEERRAETERLLALLPDARETLMRIPGVTRVSVGARERGGELTDEFVFRVHLNDKRPAAEVPEGELVPPAIAGVPTDVVVTRMPVPETGFNDENDRRTYTPKVGGSRIGAETVGGTATLGCFCRQPDDSVVLVSNWHVLIDPGGEIGDGVGHPSWRKSCCCTCGKIAEVVDFDEDLDCAIAQLDDGVTFAPKIRRILQADGTVEEEGVIVGGAAPVVLDEVWKVGATTGLTRGVIDDVDGTRVEVRPQVPFTRMSNKGDSGSVYVSRGTGMVCALHRAGNGTLGFGVPFDEVMDAMAIEVIPTEPDTEYQVAQWLDSPERPPFAAPFDELVDELRREPAGREVIELFERHREECLDLVEGSRRFIVAWHRCHGPAYVAALMRSGRDPAYRIPASFDGVERGEAAARLAEVLRRVGSPALVADLDRLEPVLLRAVADADTVAALAEIWKGSRQPAG